MLTSSALVFLSGALAGCVLALVLWGFQSRGHREENANAAKVEELAERNAHLNKALAYMCGYVGYCDSGCKAHSLAWEGLDEDRFVTDRASREFREHFNAGMERCKSDENKAWEKRNASRRPKKS